MQDTLKTITLGFIQIYLVALEEKMFEYIVNYADDDDGRQVMAIAQIAHCQVS